MAHRRSYLLVLSLLMVSLLLSACGSAPSGAGHNVNSVNGVNNVKTVIGWPFVPSASQQWAVVNGYNQGDHATVAGAMYALDFALCSSVTAQQTCDLSKGWDTASTDGQPVVSPVAGHVLYIDRHSGVDHGAADSACRTLGIQLTTTDNSYVILQLAHIERPKHYDAQSTPVPDLKVGDPVTQGEHIGFVSAVSGGGCYSQSHHIHMELYAGSDTNRIPQPFTAPWTIAGCAFDKGSTHQGELVPCAKPSAATPTSTPSPSAPLNTVDWKNFSYQSSCAPGTVQVLNGMGGSNSVTITISQVTYGNLANGTQDDAVISYSCVDTQSKLAPPIDASFENRVFVFSGNASAPVMLADLPSSTDFVSCAGFSGLYPDASSAVIDNGTLVISGPPVNAAGIDLIQTYTWNGQHFDVVSTSCAQAGP